MKTLIVEHKTSSEDISPGSKFWARLAFDPQVALYLNARSQTGERADGVLYDVIKKIALRPRVSEKPDSFLKRSLEAISTEPYTYYQRQTLVRFDSEQTESARDLWAIGKQISHSKRLALWPRNSGACSNYNRLCEYWAVCAGTTDISDPLLFRYTEHHLGEGILSVNAAKSYATCPRKYFYAHEKRMRPLVKSPSLHFGKLMHAALEEWWLKKADLDAALHAIRTAKQTDPMDGAKAEALMHGYHARWASEPMEVIAVESEFVGDLVDPDTGEHSKEWKLGGVVDGVAKI